jgi:protein-S-isoprenylcysteine O-methyltransferase Ste14
MHLLEQKTIGILLLVLMALLVSVKQLSTGSTIEIPTSGPSLLRIGNGFNLFFLLVVNPLAAIQLFTGSRVAGAASSSMDSSAAVVTVPWVLQTLEIAGLLLTVTGYLFMDWALICLGRRFQLGGMVPRQNDNLTIAGPYKLVRHPMYSAALCISLGLACLLQSWAYLLVFVAYVLMFRILIPVEEEGLQRAYGESYKAYRHKVRTLVPFIY